MDSGEFSLTFQPNSCVWMCGVVGLSVRVDKSKGL